MKQDEAKQAFESVIFDEWAKTLTPAELKDPGYYSFKSWACEEKGYQRYWKFQSTGGSDDAVERWFIDHFKQRWRY